MTREPNGAYRATLATGDRVHYRIPSAITAAHAEAAEVAPEHG